MSDIEKIDLSSKDLIAERVEQIKALFPEVIIENRGGGLSIDFEKLRLVLGDEVDEGQERYAFTWPGKADAIRQAQTPSTATLRPDEKASVDWDTTENLYIEGDNLEVLKLLQRGYHGKVKMIYIDPPYNTGHDFVYKDSFQDSIENYRAQARLEKQSAADLSGRRHSNWMSMMYPRLRLARELLTDDGYIAISIDDNEHRNLRIICDEIFGESNFLNDIVWVSNLKGRQIGGYGAAKTTERICLYSKDWEKSSTLFANVDRLKEIMPTAYKGFNYEILADNIGDYVIKNELYNTNSAFNEETRPNLVFNIFWNPDTDDVKTGDLIASAPDGYLTIAPHENNNGTHKYHAWRWGKDKIGREFYDLHFTIDSAGQAHVYTKIRDFDKTALKDIFTDISTSRGVKDLEAILAGKNYFDFAKPVDIISVLIEACTESNDIVMDFFSGSGTTAEAVFKTILVDNLNRKFIAIQLPEAINSSKQAAKDGYKSICQIGEERIRRAGQLIEADIEEQNKQLKLGEEPKAVPDIGFRVLKLDSSNFEKVADGALIDSLIKPGRTHDDIIFEMMLKWGLELSLPMEKTEVVGYPITSIAADELICCMDKGVTIEALEAIAALEPKRVFFLDSVLTDSIKLNAAQIFKRVSDRLGYEIELRTA